MTSKDYKEIKYVHYDREKAERLPVEEDFTLKEAEKTAAFHRSFPEYEETPLVNLKALAKQLGVAGIHVKDESYRFGLNAFKSMGGSYSIGNYIAQQIGESIEDLPYDRLVSDEIKDKIGQVTFITATDGNHGRGVAWTADRLGQKCVVYMPKGTSAERLENIRALGAEASITEYNYDDAVRLADKHACENGWVLVQDTTWEGYEKIPKWIMQGYMTMAYEAVKQLGDVKPTHIFLQAGVGAMAGSMAAFMSNYYGEEKPVITIVEANQADCFYKTAKADDGNIHNVGGDMATIMAGLACGEPCTIGWEILNKRAENFVSMPDYVAAKGMRVLGNPAGDDPKVVSGESGAATMGLVAEVLQNEKLSELKEVLGLDENSQILCFSTEGDTDKEHYRKVVWDGLYPAE